MVPRREVDSARRSTANRAASFVIRDCRLRAYRRKAGRARTKAEVDVLERKKVSFVEQARTLEYFAPDQHHAAADGVDWMLLSGLERANSATRTAMAHAAGPRREPDAGRRDAIGLLA
jgi:hypothetical protein